MEGITVAICTHNGEKFLKLTLQSLMEQDLSPDKYEIMVVDNNSTDSTQEITRRFIEKYPSHNVRLVEEKQKGLSYARNRGMNEASFPILAYIDDDAEANESFCSAHLDIYERFPDTVAVGGKVLPVYPDGKPPKWLSKYLWGVFSIKDLGDKVKPFDYKYPAGCNMSFRKDVLKKLGGFNPDIKYRSDEKFVFRNIEKAGLPVYYTPGSIAHHHIDLHRQSKETVIKISKITGAGERERLKGSVLALVIKFIEYLVKLIAALIFSVGFVLSGNPGKAKYLLLNRVYVISGFLFHSEK